MPRGGLIPGQRMMIDNPYMMGMGPHRGGPVPYGFHQMHSPYTPLQHGHGMIPGPPPNWQPMLHPPPFFGGPNHYFHPPQLADQHSGGYPLFVQSAQQSNFHPPSHAMNDLDHPDEVIMGDGQTYMQPSEGASYMHENDATMMALLPHMHHHHAMVPHPHPHRDEMGNLPFYPYAGNYQQLKVPLPPRKEGEAPQFVFWKQAQRIQILRDKRNINEPTRFFTKRRPKYESRVKVAKNRVRSKNGQFQPREEVKTKKSGNMIHKK